MILESCAHPSLLTNSTCCTAVTVLQAGPSGEVKVPLAELPPLAGPNARDCTPNRRPINMDSLPGTPQTAPTAGAAACTAKSSEQLLLSPPPKRAATSMKPASLAGLMSPPPARTRSSRSRQADHKDGETRRPCCGSSCSLDLVVRSCTAAARLLVCNASLQHTLPCLAV